VDGIRFVKLGEHDRPNQHPITFDQGEIRCDDEFCLRECVGDHYCPVIARANLCNLLTASEIGANSRRDDIFSASVFSAKIVARSAARQNAACWLAAPSSLS
jgi:hypothetical protein